MAEKTWQTWHVSLVSTHTRAKPVSVTEVKRCLEVWNTTGHVEKCGSCANDRHDTANLYLYNLNYFSKYRKLMRGGAASKLPLLKGFMYHEILRRSESVARIFKVMVE